MTTSEDTKPELIPTKIWKCRNADCKAWVRDEFAAESQLCPMCKGPMLRSMRHLPAVQNKIKRKPKPKDEYGL
ncbi:MULTISPECIES: cold-inducible protein YdjO-related protein [Paenibacillus]|uniref:cold-inducible protein YdjO-related protein n=1 Tax=Paenibacillus TaxID=44249 RepID=UPI000390030E|nr:MULTISPECIES: cold-inducible protein YdjO-related protein [Paenibacillus]ASS65571.1 hypothetical protein CIC07_05070 [Paenibacillus sp. RUD330]KKC46632.1 hypothetical protein VE23_05035 [Paenibacillus sp. D9]CDN45008.1 Putative uncharacterized protein [Paenibacillus sp. P22]SIQ31419.1 Cold-inducible protein YdjO [Paenibacillus sp. RU4X]SIQ53112.1 Cold-inducible protein YdjO [Paenibacillus sp. RU4T]